MPFTFSRLADGRVLLVSQAGEYQFLSREQFISLVGDQLGVDNELFLDLKAKHLVAESELDTSIDLVATKLRTRKGHLRHFTSLHMVVVTNYCDCRCDYCQASSCAPETGDLSMSRGTASKIVAMIFQTPSPSIKIEFQGGEPTLNWEVIRHIVSKAELANRRAGKNLEFVICTNLVAVTGEMLSFMKEHRVMISTSLDGPKSLHDAHRITRNGVSAYDAFRENLMLAREVAGGEACGALMTITRDHLGMVRDVVDEYVSLGFQGVFLRALNPYGSARTDWDRIGYSVEDFLRAYRDALSYILELNLRGCRFEEYYTTLLLTRMLTPFSTGFVDLQSPSGAGIGGIIYDFNGDVYPADEGRMLARMGDHRFRLGNVHKNTFGEIFAGEAVREIARNSCVESMPGCAYCAYQLYCGADPVRNYVESGDTVGYRPTSDFCHKNMGILDHLFSLIASDNRDTMDVFWSWITNRPLEDVRL